jgi:hypothetical protein
MPDHALTFGIGDSGGASANAKALLRINAAMHNPIQIFVFMNTSQVHAIDSTVISTAGVSPYCMVRSYPMSSSMNKRPFGLSTTLSQFQGIYFLFLPGVLLPFHFLLNDMLRYIVVIAPAGLPLVGRTDVCPTVAIHYP